MSSPASQESCIHDAAVKGSLYLAKKHHMRRFSEGQGGSFCAKRRKRACRKLQHVSTLLLAFLLSCVFLLVEWNAGRPLPSSSSSSSSAFHSFSQFPFMEVLHDTLHDFAHRTAGGKCDYSAGAWVRTRRRPLYSGRECRRWLSPMWACRLNANRSSFVYETLRWQPLACSLPPFHPPSFLHRMKNKTIAFVGDSLGRQQFQSLMCLLTYGKDESENVLDIGYKFGFPPYVKSNKLNNTKTFRPSSWAYLFKETNTTILFSWSPTLCHLEPLLMHQTNLSNSCNALTNLNTISNNSITNQVPEVAFHVDLPPTFLSSNLHKLDVVVLNTGPHWNLNKFSKNKWKIHIDGKPLDMNMTMESLNNLYNYTTRNLINWLNMQVEIGATMATIFYRTLSPDHFFHGEWNTGGRCDNTHYRFMNSIGIRNLSKAIHIDLNKDDLGHVKIINVTWMSQLRDEAHISKYTLKAKNGSQDCLHWCLPGVPDTWNEIFYAQLLQSTSRK